MGGWSFLKGRSGPVSPASVKKSRDTPEWICPTCGRTVTTRYCATCGESAVSPRENTLRGLAERLFQAFTSIDTKTARSVWTLIRHPGELTVSWMKGVRKPYVAPITLFLLVNVLFFAVHIPDHHIHDSVCQGVVR
jgi:hypothetical protein